MTDHYKSQNLEKQKGKPIAGLALAPQQSSIKEEMLCRETLRPVKVPRRQSGQHGLSRPGFSSSEDEQMMIAEEDEN
jgi:hypothetical protein